MADLLMLPNQQLARRVIALSLRANELAQAMHLSREQMASVRSEKAKSVRTEKQTAAVRLTDQKRHFETVIQRHQGFIEQVDSILDCFKVKTQILYILTLIYCENKNSF